MVTYSNLIANERRRVGMTQVDVCAKARVSLATLRQAERRGPTAVSEPSLRRICIALGPDAQQRLLLALGLPFEEGRP